MNLTRLTLPSEFILTFYYYYSYCCLLLSWIIAPLLFYIIWTQSGSLKSFKWLVMNHHAWSLAYETIIALIKPLILTPAPGGFPLSLLRDHGSSFITGFLCFTAITCLFNSFMALTMTIINRYVYLFDTIWAKIFRRKTVLLLLGMAATLGYTGIYLTMVPQLNYPRAKIQEWAKSYDSELEYFFNESSFFMISPEFFQIFGPIAFIGLILDAVIGLIIIIVFTYVVRRHANLKTSKLQKSLILSCVLQVLNSQILLTLPVLWVMTLMVYEIPNSMNQSCMVFICLCTHCFTEFFITLFFIAPYRRFLKLKWQQWVFRVRRGRRTNDSVSTVNIERITRE